MEGVFHFKSWFLNAPGLIHGGAYYRNFTVSPLRGIDIYFKKNPRLVKSVISRAQCITGAIISPLIHFCSHSGHALNFR